MQRKSAVDPQCSTSVRVEHCAIVIITTVRVPLNPGMAKRIGLRELSPQEVRVWDGIAKGLQNKEIAQEMNLSPRTVKFHVSNIMRKLRVQGRLRAVIGE